MSKTTTNGGAIPVQKDIDIGVTVANASNIDSEEVQIAFRWKMVI